MHMTCGWRRRVNALDQKQKDSQEYHLGEEERVILGFKLEDKHERYESNHLCLLKIISRILILL